MNVESLRTSKGEGFESFKDDVSDMIAGMDRGDIAVVMIGKVGSGDVTVEVQEYGLMEGTAVLIAGHLLRHPEMGMLVARLVAEGSMIDGAVTDVRIDICM